MGTIQIKKVERMVTITHFFVTLTLSKLLSLENTKKNNIFLCILLTNS
jgi:hypothetical protein